MKTVKFLKYSILILIAFLTQLSAEEKPEIAFDVLTSDSIFKDMEIKVPEGFVRKNPKVISLRGENYSLKLFAQDFAQGEPVYIEITPDVVPDEKYQIVALFNNSKIPLVKTEWGYKGLFAISPGSNVGPVIFKIFAGPRGNVHTKTALVNVEKTEFPRYTSSLKLGSFSNDSALTKETLNFIQECQKKKEEAFSTWSNQLYLGGRINHPRDLHKVTSPFYATRVVEKYIIKNGRRVDLKPRINVHRGLDLRGITGEPIFSMADGRVVLSEKMHYEGNMTLIDHGSGIFTCYMHQNDLLVKKGDYVKSGQQIGTVGATGAVTGSHLHIALYIRGVPVNPLGLLSLPIRR